MTNERAVFLGDYPESCDVGLGLLGRSSAVELEVHAATKCFTVWTYGDYYQALINLWEVSRPKRLKIYRSMPSCRAFNLPGDLLLSPASNILIRKIKQVNIPTFIHGSMEMTYGKSTLPQAKKGIGRLKIPGHENLIDIEIAISETSPEYWYQEVQNCEHLLTRKKARDLSLDSLNLTHGEYWIDGQYIYIPSPKVKTTYLIVATFRQNHQEKVSHWSVTVHDETN